MHFFHLYCKCHDCFANNSEILSILSHTKCHYFGVYFLFNILTIHKLRFQSLNNVHVLLHTTDHPHHLINNQMKKLNADKKCSNLC